MVHRLDGGAEPVPADLLFGVIAGAAADRFDRQRIIAWVNWVGVRAGCPRRDIVSGSVSIAVV
jgi:hypothetical protein